jgi:hypothetical protein
MINKNGCRVSGGNDNYEIKLDENGRRRWFYHGHNPVHRLRGTTQHHGPAGFRAGQR